MTSRIRTIAMMGLPALLVLGGCGQQDRITYEMHIQPLLETHCVECHLPGGAGAEASGFQVVSYDTLMKGTKFGPVVVPGDALSSSLYRLLAGEVDQSIRMPHGKDPLAPEQVALVETWIEQGAPER
ncbi:MULTISPECIES: c-type cytochrome domain-containing protein [Marichromatium]|uniref:Cytochrome c n=1 Tax=Marichromatium gracile TaxID=1048 RepID=A0A4R4A6P6_MARGR|nr:MULTISPECIES: c-type cytochrome domain-containing protein [Marichromatium]MBK1708590.1 hypothetical protein [Marichromatium gracile]MBO8084693.1 hypothetical protein [Marichromatium sp.]RNE89194.1 hypothetical protein EBL84_12470 [Marichromatium sp. AB31]TCW34481.1 cytochrome c [Marichromatium gracile]